MNNEISKVDKTSISIIEKTYIAAFSIAIFVAIIYYVFDKNNYMIFYIIFSLLAFTFAVFNDIVENGQKLFNYKSYKILGTLVLSLITTFVFIKTYQTINHSTGIDPGLLEFSVSIIFIFNLISYLAIALAVIFFTTLMLIPFILFFFNNKKETNKKTKNYRTIFNRASRFISLFFITVLAQLFDPNGFISDKIAPNIINQLVLYADFNTKHNCRNPLIQNKPVLFLQKGFVIISEDNKFSIEQCY